MKHRNYAIMVEENSHYPVSYTIKQNGEKVVENTMLKGGDMTENQIKELFFLGYFEEKPTQEEINVSSGIVQEKLSLKDSLWRFLRNEHDLILLDSEVFEIINLIDKFSSENES